MEYLAIGLPDKHSELKYQAGWPTAFYSKIKFPKGWPSA
jgi:hypothetical protein